MEVVHIHKMALRPPFIMELELENVTFVGEESQSNPRKTFEKERTNNKLKPLMALMPGLKPGPDWWEVNALTTVPLCQL